MAVTNLSFWYHTSEPAVVFDCTFTVRGNEFVAILGISGSGKTTLLRLACGILQAICADSPELGYRISGCVDFEGRAVSSAHPEFAYVPQMFQPSLFQSWSGKKNVLLAVEEDGISQQERDDADFLLKSSNLWDQARRNIRSLSGGEQQRIAICRALLTKPKVLFMDEPFANLDLIKPVMSGLLSQLRDSRSCRHF